MTAATLHIETAGAGPSLVLLHGWAMHSGVWGPLAHELATRFRVHAVDLPGHGKSAAIKVGTLADMTASVRAPFAAERDPLIVIGWSLGAMVALQWAATDAARVQKLALIAATPRFTATDDWPCAMSPQAIARFGDELRVSYKLAIVRFLSLQLQGTARGRASLALLRRSLFERAHAPCAVMVETLAMMAAADLRASVREVAQPTLVIAGDSDRLVPPAASEWLARALPNGRFVLVEGAAHVPFLSHPAAFAEPLAQFLDER